MFQFMNDFFHLPILKSIFWYLWWTSCILVAPLLLIPIVIFFLLETISIGRTENSKGRPILITGCGSGLGLETAKELAKKGWKVYAGCRTWKSVNELINLNIDSLIPVKMDITNETEITIVLSKIELENTDGLYCLINNAGIVQNGPIDWTPLVFFRQIMEINYFSMIKVTKACLPMLKKFSKIHGGSRIVQISSASGLVWGLQFLSAYSASKHAVEAFSSSLRGELKPFGIHVAVVSPAIHKTNMADPDIAYQEINHLYNSLPETFQSLYGKKYLDQLIKVQCGAMINKSWNPKNVVREMVEASTRTHPKCQYIQGIDMLTLGALINFFPRSINEFLMAWNAGYFSISKTINNYT